MLDLFVVFVITVIIIIIVITTAIECVFLSCHIRVLG